MSKAPVETCHRDYEKMIGKWKRCRDVIAGQDAVKDAGKDYLPALTEQKDDDYKAYKLRAKYFNATSRTVKALSGLILRKPPTIEAPEGIKTLLKDVTLTGKDIFVFIREIIEDGVGVDTPGILIDYPAQSSEGLTVADAEKNNLRPTMQQYPVESIINWKHTRIGNATVLSMVTLKEEADLPGGNEFENKTETRYRVLDLAKRKEDEGYVYRVRVFRIKKAEGSQEKEQEQVGGDLFPLMNNKPLSYIPFEVDWPINEPALIDLVDLNLAHYRVSADYENGCHLTGLAQVIIAGYQKDDDEKLYYGSPYAWVFPAPEAHADILSMDNDFVALKGNLTSTESQMAILGARLLTAEKKDSETAQTAQIHRMGEQSILSERAQTISTLLTKSLKTFAEWAGSPGDWSIDLNREFAPIGATPQEIAEWLKGWQLGAPGFSDAELFARLERREMLSDDVTLEDEQTRISSKPPVMPDEGE